MPILHWIRRPAEPDSVSVPAVQAARVGLAWPVSIALLALLVFTMFWAQTTLMVALIAALAAAVAGGFLLTLMFGTGWITRRRRSTPDLARYR
jgi:uncharacterized integral membrane protein